MTHVSGQLTEKSPKPFLLLGLMSLSKVQGSARRRLHTHTQRASVSSSEFFHRFGVTVVLFVEVKCSTFSTADVSVCGVDVVLGVTVSCCCHGYSLGLRGETEMDRC